MRVGLLALVLAAVLAGFARADTGFATDPNPGKVELGVLGDPVRFHSLTGQLTNTRLLIAG